MEPNEIKLSEADGAVCNAAVMIACEHCNADLGDPEFHSAVAICATKHERARVVAIIENTLSYYWKKRMREGLSPFLTERLVGGEQAMHWLRKRILAGRQEGDNAKAD